MNKKTKQNNDIVTSFLKSKKRDQRQSKNNSSRKLDLSRSLGERVLLTNSCMNLNSSFSVKPINLNRREINISFAKVLKKTFLKSPMTKFGLFTITEPIYLTFSFFLHRIILNSRILNMTLILFFISNLTFYSLTIWLNYFYNPMIVVLLFLGAYFISTLINLISLFRNHSKF